MGNAAEVVLLHAASVGDAAVVLKALPHATPDAQGRALELAIRHPRLVEQLLQRNEIPPNAISKAIAKCVRQRTTAESMASMKLLTKRFNSSSYSKTLLSQGLQSIRKRLQRCCFIDDPSIEHSVYTSTTIEKWLVDKGAEDVAPAKLSPLMDAARKGDTESISRILSSHWKGGAAYNVDSPANHDALRALLLAVRGGHTSAVRLLLKALRGVYEGYWSEFYTHDNLMNGSGLDIMAIVNSTDEPRETLLMHAVFCGHLEISKLLMEAGDDPKETAEGWSALMLAVIRSDVALVHLLLARGADVTDELENGDLQAIHFAAMCNSTEEITKHLIAREADVNAVTSDLLTPLMYAAAKGQRAIVKTLLRAGAEVDAQDSDNFTALMHAAAKNKVEVMKILIEAGAAIVTDDDITALQIAAEHGQVDAIRELIQRGARPNARFDDGYTPLIVAAKRGHVGAIEILLRRGVNVDATDSKGRTALMHAVGDKYSEAVETIVREGGDLAHYLKSKTTAVRALLAAGANVMLQDKKGWTAIDYCDQKSPRHSALKKMLCHRIRRPST